MDIPHYDPTTTQTSTQPSEGLPSGVSPSVFPGKKRRNKTPLIIIFSLFSLLLLTSVGYYFFVYQKGITDTQDTKAQVFAPDESEIEYVNETYGFAMVVKRLWNVNEFGTKVEFNASDSGQMFFDAFDDREFSSIGDVDEKFCESFETGFRGGLPADTAKQFNFTLLEQNGLKGCVAEGEIEKGIKQKYNVFYNPTNNNIYTLFYTVSTSEPTTERELAKSLSTFRTIK